MVHVAGHFEHALAQRNQLGSRFMWVVLVVDPQIFIAGKTVVFHDGGLRGVAQYAQQLHIEAAVPFGGQRDADDITRIGNGKIRQMAIFEVRFALIRRDNFR